MQQKYPTSYELKNFVRIFHICKWGWILISHALSHRICSASHRRHFRILLFYCFVYRHQFTSYPCLALNFHRMYKCDKKKSSINISWKKNIIHKRKKRWRGKKPNRKFEFFWRPRKRRITTTTCRERQVRKDSKNRQEKINDSRRHHLIKFFLMRIDRSVS